MQTAPMQAPRSTLRDAFHLPEMMFSIERTIIRIDPFNCLLIKDSA